MSSYPPSSSAHPLPAEEYELAEAGPSLSPTTNRRKLSGKQRTLTLNANDTSATLLFAAPGGSHQTPTRKQRQSHVQFPSPPGSPGGTPRRNYWASFLDDEVAHTAPAEQVHVPDFAQLLGEEEDHFAVAAGMSSQWKKRLYLLMEAPSSGREAFFVHALVTGGILFSAALTTFSTLPSFHTDPNSIKALFGLDTTIVILFTIEYIARSLAHSDTWQQYSSWALSFFPLLDLIAIFPYYIEVARHQDTSILFRFSILRTFRLLRVFRAFKYQNQMLLTIEVMYVAVQRSKDALVALSFFILLVLVLFSTLIYFAERGTWDQTLGGFVDADGDPSLFDSIPRTAWFALVTMSTVGYGDVVPRSFIGKLLTIPLLMFGLLLIALPSFVLGRNFAIVFDAMTSQVLQGPSLVGSPRTSIDKNTINSNQPTPPRRTATEYAPTAPLLTGMSSSDPTPVQPNATIPARSSPLPGGGSGPGIGAIPRMWDGGMEGVLGGKDGRGDLTNVKLAKNQIVLLEQIDSLRRQVDKQSQMLDHLLKRLGSVGDNPGLGLSNGDPLKDLPRPSGEMESPSE